jgi:hypothetical protein
VVIDPAQLALELIGAVRVRPENAEPAGIGDCGDDVAAVTERQERELNAELFT